MSSIQRYPHFRELGIERFHCTQITSIHILTCLYLFIDLFILFFTLLIKQNIESEVNIYYPRQLSIDKHGKNLLIAQMKHVQFCLDSYVQFRNSQDGVQKPSSTLLSPRLGWMASPCVI